MGNVGTDPGRLNSLLLTVVVRPQFESAVDFAQYTSFAFTSRLLESGVDP